MTRGALRAAAVTLVLLAGTGCGLSTEDTARPLDEAAAPFRDIFSNPAPAQPGASRATVYFVRNGALVPVTRSLTFANAPSSLLQAVLAGPSQAEQDGGLTTSAPSKADASFPDAGGVVTVDLKSSASEPGRSDEVLGYGQIVLTLTRAADVNGVLFVRDGTGLTVPRADGSLTDLPLTAADYRTLL